MQEKSLAHLTFNCNCEKGTCRVSLDNEIDKISEQMKRIKGRLINPGLMFGDFICIDGKGEKHAFFGIEDEEGKLKLPAFNQKNKEELLVASRKRIEGEDACIIYPIITARGRISLETAWIKRVEEHTH